MTAHNPIYLLNSGKFGQESNRLNIQHDLFLELTSTLLPVHIAEELPDEPRIADVATGTGIWMKAVNKSLQSSGKSSVLLDGFDMDTTKFPSPSTLDHNIRFFEKNCLEPFAEEFLGKYDAVHVRLLMYSLKEEDWAPAVRNLTTLLKPRGWLFWEETGYPSWISIPPSDAMHKLLQKDVEWARQKGRCLRSPHNLPAHFQEAGLQHCDWKDYSTFEKPELSQAASDAIARVLLQAVLGIAEQGGMEGLRTEDDAQRLANAVFDDVARGHEIGFSMRWNS
ncbi:hypothetical protein BT63DRAFT_455169 [Microthyrium microscopicum]|uniref:Methyltransferase domain-containing protein n=1 Tax=Microthyrium microscopicum TaxID=703497 RepID=A0A6A6UCU8_9PEZI|nr:hypothetical protein BT63DRAFT_455169 [Microthyrium microscopicum]